MSWARSLETEEFWISTDLYVLFFSIEIAEFLLKIFQKLKFQFKFYCN